MDRTYIMDHMFMDLCHFVCDIVLTHMFGWASDIVENEISGC